jgi:hypothetical protein
VTLVRVSEGGKHLPWEDGANGHAGSGFGRKSLEADLIEHTSRAETMEQQEFANVWDALSDSPDEAANMTKSPAGS